MFDNSEKNIKKSYSAKLILLNSYKYYALKPQKHAINYSKR